MKSPRSGTVFGGGDRPVNIQMHRAGGVTA